MRGHIIGFCQEIRKIIGELPLVLLNNIDIHDNSAYVCMLKYYRKNSKNWDT